jgi:4-hydroxybenzoate polyprenyltransferase
MKVAKRRIVSEPEAKGPAALLRDLLQLLRPAQWSKNAILFGAILFSKHLFDPTAALRVAAGFASFCFVASAAYVMNDLRDADRDRRHPQKKHRPIPAGRVSPLAALVTGLACAALGLGIAGALGWYFLLLVVFYLAWQVAYTFFMKEVVILDVMALATGFVVRAVAGGVVIDVPISPWLVICTFLLALFMGFAKRRHEVILLDASAADHRRSLRDYSPYFLDQMIAVVTASTVLAYATYTISPETREKLGTEYLYLTIPFVLFGIFRYLYLVHQKEEGGNPTQLMLTDAPLIVDVFLWGLTAALLLYWGR